MTTFFNIGPSLIQSRSHLKSEFIFGTWRVGQGGVEDGEVDESI